MFVFAQPSARLRAYRVGGRSPSWSRGGSVWVRKAMFGILRKDIVSCFDWRNNSTSLACSIARLSAEENLQVSSLFVPSESCFVSHCWRSKKCQLLSNTATDSIWNTTLREPWQSFKEGDATLGLDGFEFKFEKANKQKVPKSSEVLLNNKIWIAKNGSDICAPKDLWIKKKNILYKAALYGDVSCELKKHSTQLFLYCINECEGGSEFLSIYNSIDTGDSWRVWNPVQHPWYMAGLEEEKLLESGSWS